MREVKWAVRLKWEIFTEVYISEGVIAHEAISDAVRQQGTKHRSRHVPNELEIRVSAYRVSMGDD